jgi:hypothetical protein
MVARIDPLVGARNYPRFVDEEAHALRVRRARIRARAVGERHRAVDVTEQRKGHAEFAREGGVLLHGIETHAEHLNVVLVEIFLMVAEPAPLERSTRRIGGGVEPQQDLHAAKARERKRPAFVRHYREIRSRIARL